MVTETVDECTFWVDVEIYKVDLLQPIEERKETTT